MPELAIDNSIAPSSNKSGDGPKYNEDAVLLETPEEEALESEEESEDEEEPSGEPLEQEEESEEEHEEESEEEPEEKDVKIPFDRPTVKELKAKYPDIFKDFPTLKESYFRELEFTKLFPTVDDAKEAFTENEAFSTLSETLLSGDPAPLLDSIEKADSKALEIMSLSFLPSLYKKNQDLYSQAVTPIFQNLIRTLYASKDENTKNASLVLADYFFGKDGEAVANGEKSAVKLTKLTEEQERLKSEKDQRLTQSFRTSASNVQQNIVKSLEALVLKNPSYDPDKVFSPFLRKQGSKEVISRIMKQLEADKGHMAVMGSRWKRARANGYTSDDESKIVSTYLARAKSLIPDACSKVSSAMLGTRVKAADDKRRRTEPVRRENNSGRSPENLRRNGNEKVDYNKMSDLDILNS